MNRPSASVFPPACAFDTLAESYDAVFTDSLIGRAQRTAVWECAAPLFPPETHLLELNCGTGEDAVHFAQQGVRVTAIDVSEAMVVQARWKAAAANVSETITFSVRAIEDISDMDGQRFDAAFSNFSGLNCVKDLTKTADDLAQTLRPGAPLLICFSTRFCAWEVAWYLLHGNVKKAIRRWRGYHETRIGGATLSVYYPTLTQVRQQFTPAFRFVQVHGIGITVPPSYVEDWVGGRPRMLRFLCSIDSIIRTWRGLRVLGDHMLVHMERVAA